MHILFTLLQELDRLYTSETLQEYEEAVISVGRHVGERYPGFTVAYAEIYNAGADREPLGSMRHVLLPTERTRP